MFISEADARALRTERVQPRFADMSSAQRSASMDNMVRQIEALTADVIALKQAAQTWQVVQLELRVRIDLLESAVNRASLKGRIRQLVTGK